MSPFTHKKTLVGWLIALAVIATGFIFVAGENLRSSVMNTDGATFQAVHLDTGETYFGKITTANSDSVTIVDVFYFLDESKKTLVKRGDTSLTLNREHVIATENLDTDGAVLQAILKYFANKN